MMEVKELRKAVATKPAPELAAAATDQKNSSRNLDCSSFPGKFTIKKWRGKKEGNTKVVDGRTYYWRPHHKMDGHFDGIYNSSHKASENFEYKKRFK